MRSEGASPTNCNELIINDAASYDTVVYSMTRVKLLASPQLAGSRSMALLLFGVIS
jgi:hypothetical protein